MQQVPLSGVVMVTTPQEIALADVRRGIQMFQGVKVPVLGVVENMSHFVCPDCGSDHDIFGRGGGRSVAAQFDVPWIEFFMEGIALNDDLLQADRIHPTAEAQPILLDNAWPVISATLGALDNAGD